MFVGDGVDGGAVQRHVCWGFRGAGGLDAGVEGFRGLGRGTWSRLLVAAKDGAR